MAQSARLFAERVAERQDSSPSSLIGKLANLGSGSRFAKNTTLCETGRLAPIRYQGVRRAEVTNRSVVTRFVRAKAVYGAVGHQSLAIFLKLLWSFLDKPPIGG